MSRKRPSKAERIIARAKDVIAAADAALDYKPSAEEGAQFTRN